jgi:hypothetical protein
MDKLVTVAGLALALLSAGCGPAQSLTLEKPGAAGIEIPVATLQFDLVCHFTRQFDLRETDDPDARPYRPPVRRNDVLRLIIDLDRGVHCWATSCGGSKRDRVEAVIPEGILFTPDPDLVQFYRWDSGLFESRYTYEGRTKIQQGQCRIEPFSGFPPERPPPVYLREREGTGPHPFRHDGIDPDDEVVGATVPQQELPRWEARQ